MEFEILRAIQQLHGPVLDQVMRGITFLGNGGWFWILAAVLFLTARRTRRMGAVMLLALAIGFLVGNMTLKPLIARERPCWIDPSVPLLIQSPRDFSFPSGHSLSSFAAAVSMALHSLKWGVPALGLAGAVAFSRLYLYVHFPTDVLAGIFLGIGAALLAFWIAGRAERKRRGRA